MRRTFTVIGAVVVLLLIAAGAFNALALGARHRFTVRSSYAGVRTLEVDSGSGDVHLTGAPAGSAVNVASHVTEGFTAPHRHVLEPRLGALRVTYGCGTSIDCSVSYDVTVPAGVTVTVNAGDGDITGARLDASRISLESGNGDVSATLTQPATALSANSGNGDVTLVVPATTYAVQASSGNGDVNDQSLSIDHHSPRRIDASSGNGDVTITAAR
jgi:hypothetical protein